MTQAKKNGQFDQPCKIRIKKWNSYKKQKDSKLLGILMAGIFYKSYLKIPQAAFNLYEQEMIKRNLPF